MEFIWGKLHSPCQPVIAAPARGARSITPVIAGLTLPPRHCGLDPHGALRPSLRA
jgi:hypothetical protein